MQCDAMRTHFFFFLRKTDTTSNEKRKGKNVATYASIGSAASRRPRPTSAAPCTEDDPPERRRIATGAACARTLLNRNSCTRGMQAKRYVARLAHDRKGRAPAGTPLAMACKRCKQRAGGAGKMLTQSRESSEPGSLRHVTSTRQLVTLHLALKKNTCGNNGGATCNRALRPHD